MGIGRREFLRLTGLAVTGLTVNPLKAVVATGNVYINKKLGILFHKPASWGFIQVKEFGRLKDAQIIGTGMKESKDKIWKELGDPICVVTKYFQDTPENKGVFSPTITLQITPKEELEEIGVESFEELINLSHYGVSQILKDFKITKEYEPYLISGCKFYEFDAEYLFEHIDIPAPLKVELKAFKAEHNGFYYDFNCHQSAAQNQNAGREFEEFKNSIRLL